MNDLWRLVLAIVLSTLVMALYFTVFSPKPKSGPSQKASVKEQKAVRPVEKPPVVSEKVPRPDSLDLFVYDADRFVVTFSKKGGYIYSIVLKGYFFDIERKNPYYLIKGEPWGVVYGSNGVSDENVNYSVNVNGTDVIFQNGKIKKIYSFKKDSYSVGFKVEGLDGSFSVGSFFSELPKEKHYRMSKKLVVLKGKEVTGKKMKFFKKHPAFSFHSVSSVGVDDGYFLMAYYGGSFSGAARKVGSFIFLEVRPSSGDFQLFSGPKKEEILSSCDSLNRFLSFGIFTVLAKPLLKFMKLTHRFTGNYGLDILLLTLLIRIIFFPLNHISLKSMKEMQKLQPIIENLKKKYKNDKERLNRELLEMYRRHKINPLGGCLPILIQIPVFFALYDVLLYAIEFRHAPFFLWIKDLSARDPYYITPIIMGITMILQQKLTPTSTDPNQSKIMYIMSIAFTIMFATFPSGLVIYWTFNNILSIFQQLYTLKRV